MKTMHTETQKCGTCHYWIANRLKTENGQGNPIVKFKDETGVCANAQSRFSGAKRSYNTKCQCYLIWDNLSTQGGNK